jgi:hypothetical protein
MLFKLKKLMLMERVNMLFQVGLDGLTFPTLDLGTMFIELLVTVKKLLKMLPNQEIEHLLCGKEQDSSIKPPIQLIKSMVVFGMLYKTLITREHYTRLGYSSIKPTLKISKRYMDSSNSQIQKNIEISPTSITSYQLHSLYSCIEINGIQDSMVLWKIGSLMLDKVLTEKLDMVMEKLIQLHLD